MGISQNLAWNEAALLFAHLAVFSRKPEISQMI